LDPNQEIADDNETFAKLSLIRALAVLETPLEPLKVCLKVEGKMINLLDWIVKVCNMPDHFLKLCSFRVD
jgi:hypothetical protein